MATLDDLLQAMKSMEQSIKSMFEEKFDNFMRKLDGGVEGVDETIKVATFDPMGEKVIDIHGNQVVDFNKGSNFPCEVDNKGHQEDDKVEDFHEDIQESGLVLGEAISMFDCGEKRDPDQLVKDSCGNFDLLKNRGELSIGILQVQACMLKSENKIQDCGDLLSLSQSSNIVFDRGKVNCDGYEFMNTQNKPSGLERVEGGLFGDSLDGNFVWDPGVANGFKNFYWFRVSNYKKFIMIFDPGGVVWFQTHEFVCYVLVVFDPGGIRIEDQFFPTRGE